MLDGSSVRVLTFFFKFSIGVQLLYSVVFISAIEQRETAACIYTSLLFFLISFPFRSPQSIKQSSLWYTAGSHQLLFHTYQCMYVNHSLTIHTPFPCLVSTYLFSTSVSLFLPCKQVHLYQFSWFQLYVVVCFSLTYFTLCHSGPSMSLQMTQFCLFYG